MVAGHARVPVGDAGAQGYAGEDAAKFSDARLLRADAQAHIRSKELS